MFPENDDLQRQFEDAAYAYTAGNYEKAFAGFSKLSGTGHLEGMVYLARMYLGGEGVPKDLEYGIDLLICAASLGNSTAAYSLGALYGGGHYGIEKDAGKSKLFYRLAKELGCEWSVDQYLDS